MAKFILISVSIFFCLVFYSEPSYSIKKKKKESSCPSSVKDEVLASGEQSEKLIEQMLEYFRAKNAQASFVKDVPLIESLSLIHI